MGIFQLAMLVYHSLPECSSTKIRNSSFGVEPKLFGSTFLGGEKHTLEFGSMFFGQQKLPRSIPIIHVGINHLGSRETNIGGRVKG